VIAPVDRARSIAARLLHIDHDRGDVVVAAGPVRRLHQQLGGGLRVGFGVQDLLDPGPVEHAGKAVAAQEDPVPRMDVERELVDRDVVLHADGPGEDAALGVDGRLLGGEAALPDHPLDEGVVLGELLEDAVPKQVRAGIPDVG